MKSVMKGARYCISRSTINKMLKFIKMKNAKVVFSIKFYKHIKYNHKYHEIVLRNLFSKCT